MRNLPKIFLRSFENVGPDIYNNCGYDDRLAQCDTSNTVHVMSIVLQANQTSIKRCLHLLHFGTGRSDPKQTLDK